MNNTTKNNNFLNFIQKYANEQKKQMDDELIQFKETELKKAEEEGLRDAYMLIQHEISAHRADIARKLAKQEQDSLAGIYKRRREMQSEIFRAVYEKLLVYVQTDEYKKKLLSSASKMSGLFKDRECTVFISKQDTRFENDIKQCFSSSIKIEISDKIELGGIKGVCKALSICADDTLDSKLLNQVQWFTENSQLKISIL